MFWCGWLAARAICLSFQVDHRSRTFTVSPITSTAGRHLGFERDYNYHTAFRACYVITHKVYSSHENLLYKFSSREGNDDSSSYISFTCFKHNYISALPPSFPYLTWFDNISAAHCCTYVNKNTIIEINSRMNNTLIIYVALFLSLSYSALQRFYNSALLGTKKL